MSMGSAWLRLALGACTAAMTVIAVRAQDSRPAASATASRCRITGRITSGNVPLPGVSLVVSADGAVRAATSTDVDGGYAIMFAPGGTYHLSATLTGFAG